MVKNKQKAERDVLFVFNKILDKLSPTKIEGDIREMSEFFQEIITSIHDEPEPQQPQDKKLQSIYPETLTFLGNTS